MAIFNSYVSLPEGNSFEAVLIQLIQAWLRHFSSELEHLRRRLELFGRDRNLRDGPCGSSGGRF